MMKPFTHIQKSAALIVAVAGLIFTSAFPALATHVGGGELTYTHVSGGTYHLRCVFYRECFMPQNMPPVITIAANSTSCAISTSLIIGTTQVTGINISIICPGLITHCAGGSAPGYEKWIYEGDVLVPGQCADWIFSHIDGGRNATITTLQNPSSENLYLEARLNNLNGDNNSPQFTNDPIPYFPSWQNFHYNHGMFDPDGDSLVYHMICPRSAPNICVDYNSGYSVINPLSSVTPVAFDPFTGDFTMHPSGAEVAVIAYEILEYRNGDLIGSVMRDLILSPFPIPGDNPTLTGMNGTSQQIAYVFPTDTFCFDIFSFDTTIQDTLTMTWNQVIPAATFSITSAQHPTGTFCWIPAINDVRPQPYMFTARIQDNRCDLNMAGIYSYYIYVTLDSSLVFAGMNKPGASMPFFVSPNPSAGLFTIHSKENFSRICVYSQVGECILNSEFTGTVDLSSQPAGIYFVKAQSDRGMHTVKVIVTE
jgi:hypothetical protein